MKFSSDDEDDAVASQHSANEDVQPVDSVNLTDEQMFENLKKDARNMLNAVLDQLGYCSSHIIVMIRNKDTRICEMMMISTAFMVPLSPDDQQTNLKINIPYQIAQECIARNAYPIGIALWQYLKVMASSFQTLEQLLGCKVDEMSDVRELAARLTPQQKEHLMRDMVMEQSQHQDGTVETRLHLLITDGQKDNGQGVTIPNLRLTGVDENEFAPFKKSDLISQSGQMYEGLLLATKAYLTQFGA